MKPIRLCSAHLNDVRDRNILNYDSIKFVIELDILLIYWINFVLDSVESLIAVSERISKCSDNIGL